MSLSWRDELGIAVFADRLVLARAGAGLRRRLKHKAVIALEPAASGAPPWQPAVDALAREVAAGTMKGADVNVVLSNAFAHYTLVPHSDALRSEAEQSAFARHCFARVHGAQAERWKVKLNPAGPRSARLACGVEEALLQALESVLAPLAGRYRSLQPYLMASFNRWRARLGERPGWLVVAEPGLLCVALLRDGNWHSVRTVRVGSDWPAQLPGVLAREECLVDSHVDCDEVFVFAPDGPDPLVLQAGKWRFRSLLPAVLPGMAAGADAPFAVALGG